MERVRLSGYWNPDKKASHLAYRKVIKLGLEKRITDGPGPLKAFVDHQMTKGTHCVIIDK
jgi:hypothetical protein